MTDTVKDQGFDVSSAELTVAAVIDAVHELTSAPGVHRTTMHALLGAARERPELVDLGVADREALADALNGLRRMQWATLDERGFSLTAVGEERVHECVKVSGDFRSLREMLESLVGQKFREWDLQDG